MANLTYKESAAKCEEKVNATLATLRAALTEKNLDAYASTKKTLNEYVQEYNKAICNVAFAEFMTAEKPYVAAIDRFYVDAYRIKEEVSKDDGSIVGVKLDKRQSRINLANFTAFSGGTLSKEWIYNTAHLLELLQLRETEVFSLKPEDLAKKSYYFVSAAKRKMEGETPDSNTKIVRMLQGIIDELIGNTYRCTNHDIAFIQECAFQFDAKAKTGLKSMNEKTFQTVILSVAYRCLKGESYAVKNLKIKSLEA